MHQPVVPDVACNFGDEIAELIGVGLLVVAAFFDCPKRVAAPRNVRVNDFVYHIVLAEIDFVSRDVFALVGEHLFCRRNHLVVGAVDKLLHGVVLIFFGEQTVFVHVEDSRRIRVANAVFHENFIFQLLVLLHVPKHAPAVLFKLFEATTDVL